MRKCEKVCVCVCARERESRDYEKVESVGDQKVQYSTMFLWISYDLLVFFHSFSDKFKDLLRFTSTFFYLFCVIGKSLGPNALGVEELSSPGRVLLAETGMEKVGAGGLKKHYQA